MRIKRLTAVAVIALAALAAGATGGVAAADDTTTVIEGSDNSTVQNASSFNVTYDTSEINSSSTLVTSHDATNGTASVDVEIGSTTVSKSVDYGDSDEITVNYATASGYPTSVSDGANVTVDQSVTEVEVEGQTLYPAGLFGFGTGGGGNGLLVIIVAAAGALLIRD